MCNKSHEGQISQVWATTNGDIFKNKTLAQKRQNTINQKSLRLLELNTIITQSNIPTYDYHDEYSCLLATTVSGGRECLVGSANDIIKQVADNEKYYHSQKHTNPIKVEAFRVASFTELGQGGHK